MSRLLLDFFFPVYCNKHCEVSFFVVCFGEVFCAKKALFALQSVIN